MSDYVCDGSVPYFEGIYKNLGECIHKDDIKGIISFIFGWCSIGCWVFAQIPQIIKSLRLRNVESVSLFFFINWFIGDVSNLVGVFLIDGTTTQIASGIYYMFVDTVSIIENIVFRWFYKPKVILGKKEAHETLALIGINLSESSYDLSSSYSSSGYSSDLSSASLGSDTSSRMTEECNTSKITPVSPNMSLEDDYSSVDINSSGNQEYKILLNNREKGKKKQSSNWSEESKLNVFSTMLIILVVLQYFSYCIINPENDINTPKYGSSHPNGALSTFSMLNKQRRLLRHTILPDSYSELLNKEQSNKGIQIGSSPATVFTQELSLGKNKDYADDDEDMEEKEKEEEEEEEENEAIYISGMVLGYISGVMYLLARIPQSVKIFKTKSIFGLSASLFILATFADTFYFMSLVLVTRTKQDLFDFFPWMLGSGGPLIVDILLVIQYYYYVRKYRKNPILPVIEEASSLPNDKLSGTEAENKANIEGQTKSSCEIEGKRRQKIKRRERNVRLDLSSESDNYWRTNKDGTVETYVIGNKVMVFRRRDEGASHRSIHHGDDSSSHVLNQNGSHHHHLGNSNRRRGSTWGLKDSRTYSRTDSYWLTRAESTVGLLESDLLSDDMEDIEELIEDNNIA